MRLDKNKTQLAMARVGFTQAALAKAAQTTPSNIGFALNRSEYITPHLLGRISRALGVDPAEITKEE